MKEATGELNGTLVVVTAVALLAAFFFTVLWPMLKGRLENQSSCAKAICDSGYNQNHMAYCYVPGKASDVFECPFKG